MRSMFQTATPVHSQESQQQMLLHSTRRESSGALGVLIYAQLLSMSALRLLSISSTAAWISLLLTLPIAAAVYFLSAWAVKKQKSGSDGLPQRIALWGFALLFFSDMALNLFTLIELVCAYVLPNASRLLITLSVTLSIPWLLGGKAHGSAARAACLLRGFFLLAIIVCFFFALPGGDIGFLYPLWGYGGGQIFRGSFFIGGGLWSVAALPLLCQGTGEPVKKAARHAVIPLLSILLMAVLLLAYAYILPSPLLPGDWGYVLRLQLLMEMSPNTLAWSLMLISRMLLFLTAFSASGDFARSCLCRALKRERVPLWPLSLLCIPLALLGVARTERFLAAVLPWRLAAAILLSLMLLLSALIRRKQEVKTP